MKMVDEFISLILHYLTVLVMTVLSAISRFVFGTVLREQHTPLPPITNAILLESVTSLAKKIRTRELSSVEVVEAFISRIREVNPMLNCVVDERFEDALKEARHVDTFIKSTDTTVEQIATDKPLFGVPFTIKDSFYVKGLRNTCGLYLWRNDVSKDDADVVTLLRKAGAIPLALTNVPELCMWYESYNTIYGRTNNPYHTGKIPGGSSGGEGVLQASCGSAFGIGSDIGGSIRMPAFFNGVYGHKASPFIVSNHGQRPDIPEGHQYLLSVGPLCRYASDLVEIFKILAEKGRDKLNLDSQVDIKALRYFFMESAGNSALLSSVDSDVKHCIHRIAGYLKNQYQIRIKNLDFDEMSSSFQIFDACLNTEDAPTFCQELTGKKGELNVWTELIYWLLRQSRHTFPALGYGISGKLSPERGSPNHNKCMEMKETLRKKFEDMLGSDGVFLYPTHPRSAPYHYEPIFSPYNFAYTAIFNALGFPSTHCPLGLNRQGVPVGVQIVAAKNQDHLTLAVAAELEKGLGGWVPPCVVDVN